MSEIAVDVIFTTDCPSYHINYRVLHVKVSRDVNKHEQSAWCYTVTSRTIKDFRVHIHFFHEFKRYQLYDIIPFCSKRWGNNHPMWRCV